MRQYAWLDLHGGVWLLVTANPNEPSRRRTDEDAALAELKEEGWTITGPHPKRLLIKQHPRQRLCGYELTRTVQ